MKVAVRLLCFLLLLSAVAQAQLYHDPFQNPIISSVREKVEKKRLEEKRRKEEVKRLKPKPVNMFKPAIKGSFDTYTLEGIMNISGHYYLVVTNPKSGRTYILKEGDAVAPDTVIERITPKAVTLVRYAQVGSALRKESLVLKLNLEE
jgi:hypothetical protein